MTTTTVAILIVLAIIAMELIKLATRFFFGKITREDYITKAECEKCSARKSEDIICLENKLSEIRGILLVIAIKVGIPAEDLKGLTNGSRYMGK